MSMTMVGHKTEVVISLEGEYVKAHPDKLNVTPGDRLQILSTGGKHRVEFKPWPFKEEEQKDGIVTSNEFTFNRSGDFDFRCYFTPQGEARERTYKGDGGHGSVRP
jgi:plastocyanin